MIGPRRLPTIRDLITESRVAGIDRFDAMALIGYGLGRTRTWLITHDDDIVNDFGLELCRQLFQRYLAGKPLAYLTESKEFHGLPLRVTPQALIPRADTEVLVDWALALLAGPLAHEPAPRVVDLGTGTGAIALAIKRKCPRAVVAAFDENEEALSLARENAAELQLDVRFARSDWWTAASGERFDLAVSNPPYIAEGDPHLAALAHEPVTALVGGPDGLDDIRRLIADAPAYLEPGAWLLLEHGHDQGDATRRLFADSGSGWSDIATRRDLAGHERCTGARRR